MTTTQHGRDKIQPRQNQATLAYGYGYWIQPQGWRMELYGIPAIATMILTGPYTSYLNHSHRRLVFNADNLPKIKLQLHNTELV